MAGQENKQENSQKNKRSSDKLHVLIMAGGSGTRFWPKSRKNKPKQLLNLWDEHSLLEHTVDRFLPSVKPSQIWIVTTEALVSASKETLGKKKEGIHFLGEPAAKNTAPCILWGVREIHKTDPEALVAVMAADHFIGDEAAFLEAIGVACQEAQETSGIVTLGIRPTRPETGYGYIECEAKLSMDAKPGVKSKTVPMKRFVEKPDLETAKGYLKTGHYLWNAGMFIFKASTGLSAFEKCMPELSMLFKGADSIEGIYGKISKKDSVSVDYGVMEHALSKGITVSVVPADCAWNDVGSFTALEDIGKSILGDIVSVDSSANIVQSDTGLVALLGVSDLVVVRDKDVVLIASRERAQDIKQVLEQVKSKFPGKV